MQLLTYLNISTGKLSLTETGSSITLPPFSQGDKIVMGLRLTEQIDGSSFETRRSITSLKASIGFVDLRPLTGFFVLRTGAGPYVEGTNQTAKIAHSALPSAVVLALAAINIPASVIFAEGSWIIERTGTGTSLNLSGASASGASNELLPLSFVRTRETIRDGKTRYDVRLIQSPLASTVSFSPVVPVAPYVLQVQAGGTEATTVWPEIQSLTLPQAFRGTYQLVRGFKKSGELSLDDGPEELEAALNLIADANGFFTVTNPKTNVAHITFGGSMSGMPQAEIGVQVFSAPDGDTTFMLDMNTQELHDALLKSDTIKPILEIEISYQDINNPLKIYTTTTQKLQITVAKEINWNGLEAAASINWLEPPHGQSYIPFRLDQIIIGTQNYSTLFGNGAAFSFVVAHNLATLELLPLSIRNNSTGAHLVHGTDYLITAATANSVTIQTLAVAAWGVNALKVVIGTAGPRAVFQTHTHTIPQVQGLSLILDDLGNRVQTLEDLLPAIGPSSPADSNEGPVATWNLPDVIQLFPTRTQPTEKTIAEIDLAKLPRSGGLLPALYTKSASIIANTLPITPVIGTLYRFTAVGELVMPGYLGRKSTKLLTGGYYSWDGRGFYAVTRYAGTEPVAEVVRATANGNVATTGNGGVVISGVNLSTQTYPFAVALGDTPETWAASARAALSGVTYISDRFIVGGTGVFITLTEKLGDLPRVSGVNVALSNLTCSGIIAATTSTRLVSAALATGEDVYYPSDFDFELFRVHVGEKQLRLNKTFAVDFSLIAAVFNSNVSVQWGVSIDIGVPTEQGTTARNLLAVTFLPPSLDQTFILTEVPSSHSFGLRIIRKLVAGVDTLAVNRVLYNSTELSSTVLTSKNFVVRARLVRFDTANNKSDPRGLVAFEGMGAVLEGEEEGKIKFGTATVS